MRHQVSKDLQAAISGDVRVRVLGHERGRQRDDTNTCPCVCDVCQGHLACQYARAMGYKVVAIASGDDKRKLIKSYGIKSFITFNDGDVIDQVRAATGGRGAHAVIVVAGSKDAYKDQSYDEALELLEQAFDRKKVALAASVAGAPMSAAVLKCSILMEMKVVGLLRQSVYETLLVTGDSGVAANGKKGKSTTEDKAPVTGGDAE
ncbi:hypothetical protein PInf_018435 [Phytophthora infestans]|nr:hypothetical protein PInf_018435 [Phytophthora infestans]